MTALEAVLLGIVEGLTEFLPVSSTGHLVLVAHLLGKTGEGADAFEIVIQAGALLSVVVHYRALLARHLAGALRQNRESLRLLAAILVAFVPVAVVGLLARKLIKAHLFGPMPVIAALVVGGGVMILAGRKPRAGESDDVEAVTLRQALVVGVGQCFSLWPGMSRSMCTILAGRAAGLSTRAAAELSFLVALPTLGAATAYEALKSRDALLHEIGAVELSLGLVTSFVVAWAVIAAFLKVLSKIGLAPFGAYRVVVGVAFFLVFVR